MLSLIGRKPPTKKGPVYFGVASLIVEQYHSSHAEVAATYEPAQYASFPSRSPYPPNLAHANYPGAAVIREACITHSRKVPHTPDTSTSAMHRAQYITYQRRQEDLPVAECRFERCEGLPALVLDPQIAAILSAENWGGFPLNVRGLRITNDIAENLVHQIVEPLCSI